MRQLATVAPVLLVGCLNYGKFSEKMAEKDCAEGLECSPGYACEFVPEDELPAAEDCDFDRGAARECLKANWECNDNFVGFEYPLPPVACEAVCGAEQQVTDPAATNGENI